MNIACSRITALYVYLVIVASQQPLLIEIKSLHCAVRGDAVGEAHSESAPCLPILVPRLDLFRHDARLGQNERRREVRPHCVTSKVRNLGVAPGSFHLISLE